MKVFVRYELTHTAQVHTLFAAMITHGAMMMTLDDCLAYYRSQGWSLDAVGGAHPPRHPEFRSALERESEAPMEQWASDALSCTPIPDEGAGGTEVSWWGEWTGDYTPHRFSVIIPSMTVDDLWWMLEERVLHKHFSGHTCRASKWSSGNGYENVDFQLNILAQVIGAEPHADGLKVHMVINKWEDPDDEEEWDSPVEGGFADWDFHNQKENA